MSIGAICPACSASYNLADAMRGKRVRCKSCSEVFVVRDKTSVPDRDEDEERIQTSPRLAKRVAAREEEDDDEEERREPRRRPRKKRGNSAATMMLVIGGIAVGVLVLIVGVFAIWAVTRSRQPQTTPAVANANPPAIAPQPVQAPPQPAPPPPPANAQVPNPAQAQGPLAAQLSNGKVSGFGAQMEVEVNYRFTSGNPAGKRLFLLIKATKVGGLRQNYYLAELQNFGGQMQGTVHARGMSFGIEHGPFEMWLGEGSPGVGMLFSDRDLKKISNVVTVAFKQHTHPGMRPPIGPRRIRP